VCAATVIATEGVAARAAVLLRDRNAHQPELGQLSDEIVREAVLSVELLGHRRDALQRKLAHRLADQLMLGRKVEVHRPSALEERNSRRISLPRDRMPAF